MLVWYNPNKFYQNNKLKKFFLLNKPMPKGCK